MGIAQKTVPYHTSVARTSSELGEIEKSIKNESCETEKDPYSHQPARLVSALSCCKTCQRNKPKTTPLGCVQTSMCLEQEVSRNWPKKTFLMEC